MQGAVLKLHPSSTGDAGAGCKKPVPNHQGDVPGPRTGQVISSCIEWRVLSKRALTETEIIRWSRPIGAIPILAL